MEDQEKDHGGIKRRIMEGRTISAHVYITSKQFA